ncbi:hypothetical protein GGI24_005898 [Coemansia furcata]|nr:hypothetical protein GGI24_005898 [Coemansia furcata]
MAHHHHQHQHHQHHHHQHHQRSSAQSHEYLEASQSPVPSLTSATLRSSSVSSSVNSLSPDAHQATTPRDLLPQFQSVSNACHASIDSVADSVGADGTEFKKRRRDEEEEEKKEEVVVRSGGDSRSAPLPLPQQQQYQQQPESKKRRTTRRLVTGERRPLTGSTDFVKLFGLSGLYDEFVRPYIVDGQVRRTLPDLAASDYLRGVNGAVAHGTAAVDLVGLVKAPPKSQFSKLDPLPMTSIRAAFAIGNDEKTKKPVVKVGIVGCYALKVVAFASALRCVCY